MLEAQEDKYFVDGFFIRHFGVFPAGVDKEAFFDEQKVFLCYLVGLIPGMSAWRSNVDFLCKKQKIERLSINEIGLSREEEDLAVLRGDDLGEILKERLKVEKLKRFEDLKSEFGIKDKEEKSEAAIAALKNGKEVKQIGDDPKRLWDILTGREVKDGIQH